MAEYIELVRRYLRGDPEGYDGEFFAVADRVLGGVRARARVDPDLQRRAGARQRPPDRTVRGRVGAEPLPGLAVQGGEGGLADGAARGDRDPASIDVAMYVLTAVDEDPERARRAAAEHIAYYLRDIPGTTTAPPWRGFEDVVDAVRDAPSTDAGAERVETGLLDHPRSSGLPRRRGPN